MPKPVFRHGSNPDEEGEDGEVKPAPLSEEEADADAKDNVVRAVLERIGDEDAIARRIQEMEASGQLLPPPPPPPQHQKEPAAAAAGGGAPATAEQFLAGFGQGPEQARRSGRRGGCRPRLPFRGHASR